MECPDENDLGAFVERKLAEVEHAALASHLDSCANCLAIICEMARTEGAPPDTIRDHRYRLLEMVGQGAMGSVYAAWDTTLDRKIALKLVRSDRVARPEARERLLREAQAMAQVSHPNVVTVHDAGEMDGGVFIAMEFVEGTTLRRWAGGRPWREVFDAYADAGKGLAAAHRAGVVHRDFKPENVLVEWGGRVTVTDFGLARTATRGAGGAELTGPGDVLGTPSYMAPEQRAGEVVDARADQFSFALALHRALYRQEPFSVEPAPAHVTGVPLTVRRVLLRALRTRPTDRFPDMGTLLDELERAVLTSPARRSPARRSPAGSNLAWILAGLAIVSGTVTFLATREHAESPVPAIAEAAGATTTAVPPGVPSVPLAVTASAALEPPAPSSATPAPRAPKFHPATPAPTDTGVPRASRSAADEFPAIRK